MKFSSLCLVILKWKDFFPTCAGDKFSKDPFPGCGEGNSVLDYPKHQEISAIFVSHGLSVVACKVSTSFLRHQMIFAIQINFLTDFIVFLLKMLIFDRWCLVIFCIIYGIFLTFYWLKKDFKSLNDIIRMCVVDFLSIINTISFHFHLL